MAALPDPGLLRALVATAEHGSLSAAASAEHLTQQALSQRIRRLESLVGVPLLERTNRGASLTPAGRALADDAVAVLALTERALDRARRIAEERPQEFRLGHTLASAAEVVPRIVATLAAREPLLAVRVEEMLARDLPDAVRRGALDAALVPHAPDGYGALAARPAADSRLVAALAADDPAARGGSIALRALDGRELFVWPREVAPGFFDAVTHACAAAGLSPAVNTSNAGSTVWTAIGRDHGFGLIAASQVSSLPAGVVGVPLTDAEARLRIDLLSRPGEHAGVLEAIVAACAPFRNSS